MPRINKAETIMKIQALNSEKAKTLLTYLTSSCGENDQFIKAANSGLKSIEKNEGEKV